jgi:hypothetical protein
MCLWHADTIPADIPQLLTPADLASDNLDKQSLLTYLNGFRVHYARRQSNSHLHTMGIAKHSIDAVPEFDIEEETEEQVLQAQALQAADAPQLPYQLLKPMEPRCVPKPLY